MLKMLQGPLMDRKLTSNVNHIFKLVTIINLKSYYFAKFITYLLLYFMIEYFNTMSSVTTTEVKQLVYDLYDGCIGQ